MKKKSNPVIHFEIGCRDKESTARFFSDVFGWDIKGKEHSMDIETHSEYGINGHITSLGHEPHNYVNIYIEVDDIQSYLDEIVKNGGQKTVGPVLLPNGEEFAWFNDPEGNLLGLISKPSG